MDDEALKAGYYRSPGWGRDFRKIQNLTIEQLLHGEEVQMPPQHGTFKEARRARLSGEAPPQLDF